jgi:hypothetical protein
MAQHRVLLLLEKETLPVYISLPKIGLMFTTKLGTELCFLRFTLSPVSKQMCVLPVSEENWLLGRQLTVPDTKGHWPRSKMHREVESLSSIG